MNKKGFTLAEVLITLTIIGVVSALTVPTLVQNVSGAKTGPTLSKAVATFANATETMLVENDVNSIDALDLGDANGSRHTAFANMLTRYLKIHNYTGELKAPTQYASSEAYSPSLKGQDAGNAVFSNAVAYESEDKNIMYYFQPFNRIPPDASYAQVPSNTFIGEVFIDINAATKPNKQAKDLFRFYLYNDGTLRAYGSRGFDRTVAADSTVNLWSNTTVDKDGGGGGCTEGSVVDADTCAGAIFDNNLKMIYTKSKSCTNKTGS